MWNLSCRSPPCRRRSRSRRHGPAMQAEIAEEKVQGQSQNPEYHGLNNELGDIMRAEKEGGKINDRQHQEDKQERDDYSYSGLVQTLSSSGFSEKPPGPYGEHENHRTKA